MTAANNHIHPQWKFQAPKENRGILIASDFHTEWMISWWWINYKKYNDYPILIVDLGMTEKGKNFCRKIGALSDFDYPGFTIKPREFVSKELQSFYEQKFRVKNFWEFRKIWFKKPFTMLQSPFQTTLWLDLDCEVKGCLTELFKMHEAEPGVRLAPESQTSTDSWIKHGLLHQGELIYNCGVIVYTHGSEIFIDWTQEILENNHLASAEQDMLSFLLRKKTYTIHRLPDIYNWRMKNGDNPHAVIIHWVADWGKTHIADQIKKKFIK